MSSAGATSSRRSAPATVELVTHLKAEPLLSIPIPARKSPTVRADENARDHRVDLRVSPARAPT
jgi:hypothetical protein